MVRGNGKVENYYAAPLSWLHCAAFGPRMPHAACSTLHTLYVQQARRRCTVCHSNFMPHANFAVVACKGSRFFPSDLQSG